MKWIPLALIAVGIALLIWAMRSDRTSSFDDGTFIIQIAAILFGGALIIAGICWLIGLVIAAIP